MPTYYIYLQVHTHLQLKSGIVNTAVPWPFQHMFIEQFINFEIFISTNEILLDCSLLSFTMFSDLEEIISENFNISENNIISVELAKVLGQ
jgi:hypothetical protein